MPKDVQRHSTILMRDGQPPREPGVTVKRQRTQQDDRFVECLDRTAGVLSAPQLHQRLSAIEPARRQRVPESRHGGKRERAAQGERTIEAVEGFGDRLSPAVADQAHALLHQG